MNSNDISKLLRTKPHQYVVKDYISKNATSSCWSTFGVPAEVINEQDKEFKKIEGFASCKKCFATFVFRSGSKGTGTKNLSDHKCSKRDINQPTLHEVVEEKIVASPHRDELIDSIATWCATSIRPFQSNVSKSIDAVLNEFNVQQYQKSAFFIIDRGPNLKAALLPNQIIYCITHRIHNILRDTFFVSQSTTTDTAQSSRKRKRKETSDTSDDSDDSEDKFHDSDNEFDESCSGLLGEIARTINRCKKMDIIWFLEPFRRVITDLQAKHRPTLSMVVPCIWYLKDELKSSTIDSSILRFLKDRCLTYLEHKIELQDIHFAAAMLNPNYRTLRQATKAEQTQAQKLLRRIEMITKSTASPEQSASSSDSDDNRHYLSKYVDNPPASRKQYELACYLKFDHRETSSNDVLEFWSMMADSLPT
ncbi:unnamed protein product [Rotaria sordida]|uniref:BED-type domain-containing protein n=1 Tax=Rotaria sordida TaxID=392033 RepID=A0A815VXJ7_9BILA|nr:unnamed protein product [Rotaria sordida]